MFNSSLVVSRILSITYAIVKMAKIRNTNIFKPVITVLKKLRIRQPTHKFLKTLLEIPRNSPTSAIYNLLQKVIHIPVIGASRAKMNDSSRTATELPLQLKLRELASGDASSARFHRLGTRERVLARKDAKREKRAAEGDERAFSKLGPYKKTRTSSRSRLFASRAPKRLYAYTHTHIYIDTQVRLGGKFTSRKLLRNCCLEAFGILVLSYDCCLISS